MRLSNRVENHVEYEKCWDEIKGEIKKANRGQEIYWQIKLKKIHN